MNPLLRFFTPYGRMRRWHYWIVLLGTILWTSVTVGRPVDIATINGPILAALFGVVAVFVHYVHVCIVAKRLHDMGLSAWWILILVANFAVAIIGERLAPDFWSQFMFKVGDWATLHLISAPWWLAFWCWIGFWPGDPEHNRFGTGRYADAPMLRAPKIVHGA